MQDKLVLTFQNKPYLIPTQFHGYDKCSSQVIHDLVFSSNHTHNVSSNISEDIFQALIDFMVNGNPPQINKENFIEYLKINEEFQFFSEFITKSEEELGTNMKYIIYLQNENSKQDKSFCEIHIARNLDIYLQDYYDEMMKIPIQSLQNIFVNPQRKLDNHEKAYQFIKRLSKSNTKYFILLPSLDGCKLARESQIECELKKKRSFWFLSYAFLNS